MILAVGKNNIKPNKIENFTINNKKKTMITFASDIQDNFSNFLLIQSNKTSKIAEFIIKEKATDKESDLLYWVFVPTENTQKEIPVLKDYVITIYND